MANNHYVKLVTIISTCRIIRTRRLGTSRIDVLEHHILA